MISLIRSSTRALSRSARSFTSSASLPASASTSTSAPSSSTPATRSSVPPSVAAIPYHPAQIPTAARQQQLVDLRNAIFGTNERAAAASPPPRDGSKILKQRLHGPALVRWYGDRYTSWKAWNQKFPGLDLVDLQEQQRSVYSPTCYSVAVVPDIFGLQAGRPRSTEEARQSDTKEGSVLARLATPSVSGTQASPGPGGAECRVR